MTFCLIHHLGNAYGGVSLGFEPCFIAVQQKEGQKPLGLQDCSETLVLTRARNTRCGISARIQFAVTEQRQGVYEWNQSQKPKTEKEMEHGGSKTVWLSCVDDGLGFL